MFTGVYGALVLHIDLQKTKDERGLIYELTDVNVALTNKFSLSID